MQKLISADQAAALIKDHDSLLTGGFVGIGFAESLAKALARRFQQSSQPRHLTLVYAAGQGDGGERGLNHLALPGLLKTVIGGHWGLVPKLGQLVQQEAIEAYNLPQGIICHLFRDIAAKRPGTISKVGLHTFVDPRYQGGRLNQRSQQERVKLLQLGSDEYLFYPTFAANVAFLRGTTADKRGNISMEKEALPLEALAIAQAVHNSGGKVIVQVERLTEQHLLPPDRVRIPGILVDHVVLAEPGDHPQTFSETYNPAYCHEISYQPEWQSSALDLRKLICRRALLELDQGAVVNLGIGMPEGIAQVAAEEQRLQRVTLTIEPGAIGGHPASGLSFGAVAGAEAIIDQPAQFDFYDGGGLDQAFLGMAEVSQWGDVNVSRFANKLAGAGGFINISQNAKEVYFLGSFTSGPQDIRISDGQLHIIRNGAICKFVEQVQHLTFNGRYANQRQQRVCFITERAVFQLSAEGLILSEIAPGVDLHKDVLELMGFRPLLPEPPRLMDSRLFRQGPMHLNHQGSQPLAELRQLWRQLSCP